MFSFFSIFFFLSLSQISTCNQSESIGSWLNLLIHMVFMFFLLSVISNIITISITFYYLPLLFLPILIGNITASSCILVILPMQFSLFVPCFIAKDLILSLSVWVFCVAGDHRGNHHTKSSKVESDWSLENLGLSVPTCIAKELVSGATSCSK